MSSSDSMFQIIGEVPELTENSQIVFEDEIPVNSFVFFEKKDNEVITIKLVNLEHLDEFDKPVYRIGKGDEPGQIVFEQIEIETLKEIVEAENQLDEMLNLTFDNLAFFYRDNDLSDDLINKYTPGLILQERGFVDVSYHRGGFAAKHRFLIASSQGQDLSGLPGGNPARGLIVIKNDSFFKVLDVSEKENRKQITLLNIPKELVDFFSGEGLTSMEEQIVEVAKADFDTNFNAAPVDVLTDPDWLNRLTAPVGISDDGKYFYSHS